MCCDIFMSWEDIRTHQVFDRTVLSVTFKVTFLRNL